ncbi:hypothetical protein A2841_00205 [Candidatus Kaiserbacteria bacterium RIFCSPHIGHO2_01_FULL_48_10]|uniref:NADH:quinone oxidoreductase/Mrp antiporter membrane subunit domain-containing protein n=1 Tax=Candidatus Kaiserbacteria bacterium RIFCSPHIGHO2_01_FULL_48_10 TaxID=1798476 RepID=A0A1F6C5T6_9BACT|nr:MAG: hypothetical protein A2841_00205 [Candidatus Kaiserbacteria bacterium RIFCSPHIGHO2_01_FULL_48_10]
MSALFLIPLTFLVTFGAIVLFGRKLKHQGALLALSVSIFTFLLSAVNLLFFATQDSFAFTWFQSGDVTIEFSMLVDRLTMVMVTLVTFITTLVLIYSRGYMRHDANQSRFWAQMCLFAGSMTGIVLAGNVPTLMVFWGLVGASSYLLIGFWHQKPEAAEAARKAFTIISLGDALLFAGLLILFGHFHTFDFHEMIARAGEGVPMLAMLLVFGGIAAKSAQFPLFAWLGWAMEGPTPVSALLHSATMVKAGIFVGLKLFPLFLASGILPFVFAVGLVTVFISSILAIFERDIKKILAWSTVSQLGFMTIAFGLGSVVAAFFQLVMHAFFKALLFLDAGNAMHLNEEKRDLYTYDPSKFRKARIVLFTSLIGTLGLAGVPPTNGFFSKDLILETVKEHEPIFFGVILIAVFLSAMYSFRWFFLLARPPRSIVSYENAETAIQIVGPANYSSIQRSSNGRMMGAEDVHREHKPLKHYPIFELPFNMLFSPLILSVLVLSAGIFLPYFVAWFGEGDVHFDFGLMSMSVVIVGIAAAFCYFLFYRENRTVLKFLPSFAPDAVHGFLKTSMGIESLYCFVGTSAMGIGRFLAKVDKHVWDALIDDVGRLVLSLSKELKKFDIMHLDRLVNDIGTGTLAVGRESNVFDQRIIDRLVSAVSDGVGVLGWKTRLLVNGIVDRYLAYVAGGVLVLLIIIELLFLVTR